MKDAKPKPRASKLLTREAAKPLVQPESQPPEGHPIFNLVGPALEAQTHHPPPTDQPPPTTQPVAPERDFVRVPNSVVRDALPAGLFKGESKKTWDALYQRTRGARVPRRSIRATLAEVQAWARVSHNTLKAHLKHLSRVGLLKVHYVRGDNTGAEYEVFTPEEAPPTTHQPQTTHRPATSQNVAPPTSQNVVLGGGGQTYDFKELPDTPKTSLIQREQKLDDERVPRPLASAERELTGKNGSPDKWDELWELLTTELKIAAGRTGSVSSVPAFLTEHLRRRLWKRTEALPDEKPTVAGDSVQKKGITEDISKCPDCFGTGLEYPEGYENGVRRCSHARLYVL